MDHDSVRDWIDEAFFADGARDTDSAAAQGVRAHLAVCAECAKYDEQTRRAALKLDLARGPTPQVRTRVLEAAGRIGRARREAAQVTRRQPWWRSGLAWRLAGAALVIAIVGVGAGAWWANGARPDSDADHLSDAVAMMSTLVSTPGANELVLRDATGSGSLSGMAVVSAATHQMAVFATHLPAANGYHCYLERAGHRTWIGSMYATPDVQFWAGAMDSAIDMQPGDLLVVAADANKPAVLSATL